MIIVNTLFNFNTNYGKVFAYGVLHLAIFNFYTISFKQKSAGIG